MLFLQVLPRLVAAATKAQAHCSQLSEIENLAAPLAVCVRVVDSEGKLTHVKKMGTGGLEATRPHGPLAPPADP